MPNGAAGFFLLAHTQELQGKQKDSIKFYKMALERDPTLWCAYERLCLLVPLDVEPPKIFTEDHPAVLTLNNQIHNCDITLIQDPVQNTIQLSPQGILQ